MSVRTRVTRLEGKVSGLGLCPLCRGAGKEHVVVDWGEGALGMGRRQEQTAPSAPQGCPACGRSRRTVVRVDFVDRVTRPGVGGC